MSERVPKYTSTDSVDGVIAPVPAMQATLSDVAGMMDLLVEMHTRSFTVAPTPTSICHTVSRDREVVTPGLVALWKANARASVTPSSFLVKLPSLLDDKVRTNSVSFDAARDLVYFTQCMNL